MEFIKTAKDILVSEEWPSASAASCKNLEMFCPAGTELWLKKLQDGKVKVTHQGHQ